MAAHPMLRPLGRRIAVTLICAVWAGFEAIYAPGEIWLMLALAATAWAVWDFFLSGNYKT